MPAKSGELDAGRANNDWERGSSHGINRTARGGASGFVGFSVFPTVRRPSAGRNIATDNSREAMKREWVGLTAGSRH